MLGSFLNAPALFRLTAIYSVILYLSGCSGVLISDGSSYYGPGGRSVDFSDFVESVYHDQLIAKKEYPRFKMALTPEVTRHLAHYSDRDRKFVVKSYNNRQIYLAEIRELFKREGVPLELINVGAVESKFNPNAVSRSGAAGIWQFMKPTGRSYDLTINFIRDERRDPVKSSWAAARHLGDLYDEFDDWYLALAAYNAGSGSVRRAIKRGKSRDFWQLARGGHFRRQTADYVPRVIAMSIIMQDLGEYGFVEMAGEVHPENMLLSFNK